MNKKERCFYGVTIDDGVVWDCQGFQKLYTQDELFIIRDAIDNTIRQYEEEGITKEYIASHNEKSKNDDFEVWRDISNIKKEPKVDNSDLYLILNTDNDTLKIGKSTNVRARLKQLQVASSDDLKLIGVISKKGYMEGDVHSKFQKLLIRGEWFMYDKSILEYFIKLSNEV